MANFETHLAVASMSSGIFSITTLAAIPATPSQAMGYFLLGVVGGLLPDIDSDNSIPIKIFFNLLALGLAFAALFGLAGHYSLAELVLIWLGIYLIVRFIVFEVFTKLTVHRGIIHSLLAAIFFGALTTSISYHMVHLPTDVAWLSGFALLLGFVVHLSLDELFSVDILNNRVKRSFGTALKLADFANWPRSILLTAITLVLIGTLPDPDVILNKALDPQTYINIRAMLFPDGQWFANLVDR